MKKILIPALSLFLMSSVSFAQEVKKDGPCHTDAEKFCHEVKPGQGRIIRCMKEHKSELSPECRERIEEKKEKVKARIESCETDRQKLCSDVKGGKKRMNKCMREHKDQLSQECRAFFK